MFFGVTDVTFFAYAIHRTQWQCVLNGTDRMLRTWFRLEARILAGSAEASQFARTVGVHFTLVRITYWYLFTSKAGISRVSGRASARRPMIVNSALGTRSAIAWIAALFVLA